MKNDTTPADKSNAASARDASLAGDATAPNPAPASAVEVLDAERLVQTWLQALPTLRPFTRLLPHVAALIAQEKLGTKISDAMEQLEAAGINAATITAGIKAMNETTKKARQELARRFQEKTGDVLNLDTLDVSDRTAAEIAEQVVLRSRAIALRERVHNLRAFFFPGTPPAEGIQKWFNDARALLNKPVKFGREETEVETDAPDWQTPPVLDEKNVQVAKLLKQVGVFESVKAKLAGDRGATLKQLGNLMFTTDRITEILDAADALAGEQIVHSDTISRLAERDQASFAKEIESIMMVQASADQAEAYKSS